MRPRVLNYHHHISVRRWHSRKWAWIGPSSVTTFLLASCGSPAGTHSFTPRGILPAPPAVSQTNTTTGTGAPTPGTGIATYLAQDGCASVQSTTPISQAPSACRAEWVAFDPDMSSIPGQDLMTNSRWPTQLAGLPSDPTAATAMFRTGTLQLWAIANGQLPLFIALQPTPRPHSDIEAALSMGAHIDVPQCMTASSMTAVHLGDQSLNWIKRSSGYLNASATAIVLTFSPCAGATAHFGDGHTTTLGQTKSTTSVVETGTVKSLVPLGSIWAVDGVATCGPPLLADVCPR